MAGLAQGHKIIFSMSAAAFGRDDVMYLISWDKAVVLKALFTERVFGNI